MLWRSARFVSIIFTAVNLAHDGGNEHGESKKEGTADRQYLPFSLAEFTLFPAFSGSCFFLSWAIRAAVLSLIFLSGQQQLFTVIAEL